MVLGVMEGQIRGGYFPDYIFDPSVVDCTAHPGASHTTPFPPGYPAPYPPYNGAAPTFASFTHPYSGVTQHFPGLSSPEPAGETKPGT